MNSKTWCRLLIGATLLFAQSGFSKESPWKSVNAETLSGGNARTPRRFQAFKLDARSWDRDVKRTPDLQQEVQLPMPDGKLARFQVQRYEIFEPLLAAKYPDIVAYQGIGIDDPSIRVHLDWTAHGLNAILLGEKGTAFVAPFQQGNRSTHIAYWKSDQPAVNWEEPVLPAPEGLMQSDSGDSLGYTPGNQLMLFRAAITSSRYFTNNNGGTVPLALAAVASRLNQLNAIYTQELAVRLILVNDNDKLIFTDATDPGYGEPCDLGESMAINGPLNQTTLDNVIGSSNYDIGHVFVWNTCGGVANYGLCVSGTKARGVTGAGVPIDILAHEMGHQFYMGHTWTRCNGTTGGQYSSSDGYELASGTTIMGYPGICGADNVATVRLNQFHSHSLGTYMNHATTGGAATCGTVVDLSEDNTRPTVSAGTSNAYFPKGTPFTLVGSASDADGDTIVYTWEEMDQPEVPANGSAPNDNDPPFFAVLGASTDSSRIFPQLQEVLTNDANQTLEFVPVPASGQTRTVKMRLVAQDRFAQGGGVTSNQINVIFTGDAGPFEVTSPNTAVSWNTGSAQTITWNVASTTAAPINCGTVNVGLSTDGGSTFPYILASGVPNDGSESVTLPAGVATSSGRIRVACAALPDHYFFDISNANLTIQPDTTGCVTSLVVRSLADSGACSLRDTVAAATSGQTVTFDSSLTGGTINLLSNIVVNKSLIIDGGDRNITIDGNKATRLFTLAQISPPTQTRGTITMRSLRLTRGNGYSLTHPMDQYGGAIAVQCGPQPVTFEKMIFEGNDNTTVIGANPGYYGNIGGALFAECGTVTITNSTFRNNKSRWLGGAAGLGWMTSHIQNTLFVGNQVPIYSNSNGGALGYWRNTMNVTNSTFTENLALGAGGAIGAWDGWVDQPETITLTNSTLFNNAVQYDNGRNIQLNAPLRLRNTIVAGGTAGKNECLGESGGVLFESTNSLVQTDASGFCTTGAVNPQTGDPRLAALSANGGWTQTLALLADSPALGNGSSAICSGAPVSSLDQRGYTRPASCDIGAFEAGATLPAGAPDILAAQSFSVDEGSALGSTVGTLQFTAGTGTTSFSILGGNTDETFSIHPTSGLLSVQKNRVLYALQNPQFVLQIRAVDSGLPSLADIESVTVQVNDVNLPPIAQDASFELLYTAAVGTSVGTAPASDRDPLDQLGYAITAGNTGNAFAIHPISGEITVANASGFSTFPTYNLTVRVSDNGSPSRNDNANITIQIRACSTGLVTSTADSGPCTLRQAVTDAAAGSTIRFGSNLAGQTITLTSQIDLNKTLTIDGESQNVTVSGGGTTRVFQTGAAVVLQGFTIRGGAIPGNGSGGAVYACGGNVQLKRMYIYQNGPNTWGAVGQNCGTPLTIEDSTFEANTTTNIGSALYLVNGTHTVRRTTFIGNTANRAIRLQPSVNLTLTNCTFSGNSNGVIHNDPNAILTLNNTTIAGTTGNGNPGISNDGQLYLRNSILADKTASGAHCSVGGTGTIVENVNTLIEDGTCNSGTTLSGYLSGDPALGVFGNNGGLTKTYPLLAGSTALDSGSATVCSAAPVSGQDQRQYLRNGGPCDRGAFEVAAGPLVAVWDGGGTTNNWSEAANWVGDVVPSSVNEVIFDSTSTKSSIVDAGFGGSVTSLTLGTGYTGVIALQRSLAVTGNLAIAKDATLDLQTQTFTVEGTLTNNGKLRQIKPATAVGTKVEFLRLTNAAGTSARYFGVEVTPSTASLGNVTVEVRGNQLKCSESANDDLTKRCFDVTAANPGSATVRFYFTEAERKSQEANALKLWYQDASGQWSASGSGLTRSESDILCMTSGGSACWVQALSVAIPVAGKFALGDGAIPTALTTCNWGLTASTSWSMFSPACDHGSANTVQDLLAGSGKLDASKYLNNTDGWAILRWNAQFQFYQFIALDHQLVPGEGYWLRNLGDPKVLTVTGSGFFTAAVELPLSTGWNLTGNPYSNALGWGSDATQIRYPDTTLHTIEEAQAAGLIERLSYSWTGAGYQTYTTLPPLGPGSVNKALGLWVRVLQPGTSLVLTQPSGARPAARANAAWTGWNVRLSAEADGLIDPINVLGRYNHSEAGLDSSDLPELAPAFTPYLTVVFPRGAEGGDLMADLRARGNDSQPEQWAFEVRTDDPTRQVTLRWSGPQAVLARSQIVDPASGQVLAEGLAGLLRLEGNASVRKLIWKVGGGPISGGPDEEEPTAPAVPVGSFLLQALSVSLFLGLTIAGKRRSKTSN